MPVLKSPACGATGVSQNPTIAFSGDTTARCDVSVEVSDPSGHGSQRVWSHRGMPATLTLPSAFLLPATVHAMGLTASTPIGSAAHKEITMRAHVTTGP